jgi:signal transduction histidine kinase
LQPEELTALARETGLLGINQVETDGSVHAGPPDWRPTNAQACALPPDRIHYDLEQQTAVLVYPGTDKAIRCIQIGLDADTIVQLRNKTALPVLLATLSRLPGIEYVRLEKNPATLPVDPVRLVAHDQKTTAEAQLPTPMGTLVVGLEAANHLNRVAQLHRQFFLFAALLLLLGLFFSWLLYRHQQADLGRTRSFERLLAKEHEAAALGRATATIAHEVRNPLNAINMGLQRLSLESPNLSEAQQNLIDAMTEAVHRADTIIGELRRFTRKLQPRVQPVDPGRILNQLLTLYQGRCTAQQIAIHLASTFDGPITADPELLTELLENLLKNSIEAQPAGGFIDIAITPVPQGMQCTLTNGGCTLNEEELGRLGEPYFTTKTRGTGLGLALCRRIAEAHGGQLLVRPDPGQQQLTVVVNLPRTANGQQDTAAMTPPVPVEGAA